MFADSVICALIGAVASIIVNIISSSMEKKNIYYRLDMLEKSINKHNSYGDKISTIQQDIAVIKTELKNML